MEDAREKSKEAIIARLKIEQEHGIGYLCDYYMSETMYQVVGAALCYHKFKIPMHLYASSRI